MTSPLAPDTVLESGGVLIVGAGLAGLFTALSFKDRPVTVLAASRPGSGASSGWAQGGIAAPLGSDDTVAQHVADTVAAGAGLVDPAIIRMMAEDAPARIEDLLRLGVPFDKDASGHLMLGREAAHSRNRIVRVKGDRAGAEIMRALGRAALARPNIRVLWGLTAIELGLIEGRVAGLFAQSGDGRPVFIAAEHVIFALGGVGALYGVTTNPADARGQGIAMAARAGAAIADAEFVQFHPTAIDIGRDPAPLATEALRGEGAKLVNKAGERFMLAVHPDAELAPRDVVARAIHREIAAGRGAFLDARQAVGARFPEMFPTVFATCIDAGLDPRTSLIPVAPAAHYHMGGIAVDRDGRTAVKGLWACGEVTATGAHGANRLASNSLLEAIVFAARVAKAIEAEETAATPVLPPARTTDWPDGMASPVPHQLRTAMTEFVGLERSEESLREALATLARLSRAVGDHLPVANAILAARFIATAALLRRESRGGHARSDYPASDSAQAVRRALTLADLGDDDAVPPLARHAAP
ncbi:MAG: L-aspartate oxidase [Alphaproteobacteria bacterium]|nr:L-aspartate oxidase [Alphaproteobacteria bacterium]